MSTDPIAGYDEVLARVRSWTPELRIQLAKDLLRSLPHPVGPDSHRGVSVEKVHGAAVGTGRKPNDDTVRRWIEEHREEKYL